MEEKKIYWTDLSPLEARRLLRDIEIVSIDVIWDLDSKRWIKPVLVKHENCLVFDQESVCGSFYLYGKRRQFLEFVDKFFERYQIRTDRVEFLDDYWFSASFSAFIGRFFNSLVNRGLVELVKSRLIAPREKPHGLGDICFENYYIMREIPETLPVRYPFPVIFV